MVKSTLLLAAACLLVAAEAKEYHTKVVILGGGVSGISAALNLTAAGVTDFMMVEARDILGGRAQDTQFGDVNVELGCNWVQGLGTNPINQLALKYNLSTAFSDSADVQWYGEKGKYNGTEIYNTLDDAFSKVLDIGFEKLQNDEVDISGRVGLDLVGWQPSNAFEEAAEFYYWDWEFGETPELSSTVFAAVNDNWTYSGFGPDGDGNNYVVDQRGFKHIFLEESKKVFKTDADKRLLLNTTVTKIAYNNKGVTVHTSKGDTIHADYAITTFSLGVLQHDDIEWSPALPDWKREGLYGFHMATYTKIFFNFPYQFWDDSQFTVWADPDRRGYMNAWQNLNAPGYFPKNTSTNIFFVTTTQDLSYEVENKTDEEVKEEIMVVLRKMYGNDIPEPTDFMFPRWHTNPLFRGSYSNWPIGELDEHHANMKAPLNNRVFFAGEALSTEYFGFLQGAWFTGAKAGVDVALCLKGRCPRAEYYPEITNAKIRANIIHR
ncbi:uncharacterized protein EV154DRAFT_550320 [Mucor mucedo]|uniref:uncharacterized protein n=1 Tax=Mucor mucedo TaxID=29922 RepID=UPI00221EA668|nr:uncharacterized protein EV154DRAFT_550320 [Mucor mucedo]KAI7892919.1 hypothetical protein EV154DRAFT_550320 [Mucor mucedo]